MSQLEDRETARQALRQAQEALDAAQAQGASTQLSQALLELSRCQRRLAALADAVWYARRSLQVARDLGALDDTVGALCELAELSLARAERLDEQTESHAMGRLCDGARSYALEAARRALQAHDPRWELAVLLRLSDVFDRLGDHDDAIALQCRAVTLMTSAEFADAN